MVCNKKKVAEHVITEGHGMNLVYTSIDGRINRYQQRIMRWILEIMKHSNKYNVDFGTIIDWFEPKTPWSKTINKYTRKYITSSF